MTYYKKEQFLMIDRVAKRYGVLPSSIRRLPMDDFLFDQFTALMGHNEEHSR